MLSRRRFLQCASGSFGAAALARPFGALGNEGARRRALLVGVAEYPKASGARALAGAANDVRLMRDVLQRHGFAASSVVALTDDAGSARLPTRSNILGQLGALADDARRGDFFYLHFSGHGSQQPASPSGTRRPEPDGLSEMFLPLDIGRWSGARSAVDNAIVDDDLDRLLERFLERGAFVWAVFDACHSGTLMRGLPDDEVVLRHVDPEFLGVPAAAMRAAAAQAATRGAPGSPNGAPKGALAERDAAAAGAGGFVAFYAAQTTEVAPEMAMPLSLPAGHADKRQHGVLTFTLAEALSTHPGATYRQVSQFILSRYASQYIANKPTPLFTGTRLDAAAFGTSTGNVVRQWPLARGAQGLSVPVGLLGQVSEGARFAIMRTPLAADNEALGELETRRAGLFDAELAPIAADGKTLDVASLPDGAYARLTRPALNFGLRVALPVEAKGADPKGAARSVADAAIVQLRAAPPGALRIEWQPAGRPAQLRLHVEDDRLWLLPATGALVKRGSGQTPSLGLERNASQVADLLGDSLTRVGKALNLVRLAEQLPPATATSGVDIRLEHLPQRGSARRDLAAPRVQVRAGDSIGFMITNRSRQPVDCTLLYVDSAHGITPIFPLGGENNRLEPDAQLHAGAGGLEPIQLDDSTTGTERLIAIVSAATAQSERADYTYLAQPRLETTRSMGGGSSLQTLLNEAAFGITTRGAGRTSSAQASMRVFTWDVIRGGAR